VPATVQSSAALARCAAGPGPVAGSDSSGRLAAATPGDAVGAIAWAPEEGAWRYTRPAAALPAHRYTAAADAGGMPGLAGILSVIHDNGDCNCTDVLMKSLQQIWVAGIDYQGVVIIPKTIQLYSGARPQTGVTRCNVLLG
jgi:hypothetical protein